MLPMMLKYVFMYKCTKFFIFVSLYVLHSHAESELCNLVPVEGVPANELIEFALPRVVFILHHLAQRLSCEVSFQHALT